MSIRSNSVTCRCCGVHHDPSICPQCQSAGCPMTLGKKTHRCHLQTELQAAMKLSPLQLQVRIVELERENLRLVTKNRKLVNALVANGILADKPSLSLDATAPNGGIGKISREVRA